MTVTYHNSDKATNHLLDFIAGGVEGNQYGESGGNYNAVYGSINATAPLHHKNLTQIYEMQTQMVNTNGVSSATGRYQALKGTLQEYQSRNKLPNHAMFTQRLQDDFGLCKMTDRGYSKWWNHELSDDEFMHRLSCEWASLPDPYNGGKSHYDGDSAGNHASTTLDYFRAALRTARGYINGVEPVAPAMDTDMGVRTIQATLVQTGDLASMSEVDGVWGTRSEAALRALLARDK